MYVMCRELIGIALRIAATAAEKLGKYQIELEKLLLFMPFLCINESGFARFHTQKYLLNGPFYDHFVHTLFAVSCLLCLVLTYYTHIVCASLQHTHCQSGPCVGCFVCVNICKIINQKPKKKRRVKICSKHMFVAENYHFGLWRSIDTCTVEHKKK